MAYRVSEAEVIAIMDTDLTEAEMTSFIIPANLIVTARLGDQNLGDATLKEIERYLAAHFASLKDPMLKAQSAGGASDTYHVGSLGQGLDATEYGQRAKLLDTTNRLANAGKKPVLFKVDNFKEATG